MIAPLFNPDGIPDELKALRRWVPMKKPIWSESAAKWLKVPIVKPRTQPRSGLRVTAPVPDPTRYQMETVLNPANFTKSGKCRTVFRSFSLSDSRSS
jgi:hypothetical protein